MSAKAYATIAIVGVLFLSSLTAVGARGGGFGGGGGFHGGGFGGSGGGFDFHNDASGGFGGGGGHTPDTFNKSNFNHDPSSGNYTYHHSTTATNDWGQTYHSSTVVHNGNVYHGSTITNPVYHGYSTWGWNGGVAWYPAPYYWGGGFWGPFAVGAVTAAAFGTIVYNNTTYTSYQTEPQSAGAKLLSSYHLTQTPCGPPKLVVIYGPNNSVICAKPDSLVAAGNYSVNTKTLTITSEKGAST